MKKLLLPMLIIAALSTKSFGQDKKMTLSSTGEFVLDRPDLKPVKGMIVFEKGIEQYGIRIDSNYYFVRYRSLVPVKKEVKGFKVLPTK